MLLHFGFVANRILRMAHRLPNAAVTAAVLGLIVGVVGCLPALRGGELVGTQAVSCNSSSLHSTRRLLIAGFLRVCFGQKRC